jgi:hypothetical protein
MENQKSVVPHDEVPAHVRHHLTSQPQSGLSIPRYCSQNSITAWSFYQWRKRYQSMLNEAVDSKVSFHEIGTFDYSGCLCDIRFPSGITVSIRRGVSPNELSAVFGLIAAQQQC